MSEPPSISGSCACGACSFTANAAPSHINFCYCVLCQYCSGAPFMAWTAFPKAAVTWQGGSSSTTITTWQSTPIAVRTFCSKCGSNLGMQYDCYPDRTHIATTAVKKSAAPMPPLAKHIFVKDKPDWYQIPDDGVVRIDAFGKEFEDRFPDVIEKLKGDGSTG